MSLVASTLSGRVSRREIAGSPFVWIALTGVFAVFAAAVVLLAFVMPGIHQDRLLVFGGLLAISAAGLSVTIRRPPLPGARITHAILAMVYVGPALAIYAFAPHGSAAIASAVFIGPLTCVWIVDRRQIAAHFVAAAFLLFLPSILGTVDQATLVACITLVPAVLVLGICCVLVMEAAENQGRELEILIRRDPLTGVGNRRLLDEELTAALERHAATGEPLTLLALDLNGFKAVNDVLGHAAGDELLGAVGRALSRTVRDGDTVVRQGGDEFCVVLPATSADQAVHVMAAIRGALVGIDRFGAGITTGLGAATLPGDAAGAAAAGNGPAGLLALADERLLQEKERALTEPRAAAVRRAAPTPRSAQAAAGRPATPTTPSVSPPTGRGLRGALQELAAQAGISRRQLAHNRPVWIAGGVMYLMYAVIGTGVCLWAPQLAGPAFPYVVGLGAVIGLTLMSTRPAAIGTRSNHLVVSFSYLVPAAILITCDPSGSVAIGAASFVGPLTAVRLVNRRHIVAHYLVASSLFLLLIPAGYVDAATTVAILMLVGTIWVLGICCVFVLEAAEAQGRQLAQLVRRDPLTGVGNRRMLDHRLAAEVRHHRRGRREFTLLTLDLNGFKALNDTLGHGAGDDLLRQVATALQTTVRVQDCVVRQGGDEFCVVLPGTGPEAAEAAARAIREAVAALSAANGVTTGIGIAAFPADGAEPATLLARADERLRLDKYGGRTGQGTAIAAA